MPSAPSVWVIGETPSLAAAVAGLLEADGLRVRLIRDLRSAEARSLRGSTAFPPVLVCASNGFHCNSVRHWKDGALGQSSSLIVVGTRDPELRSSGQMFVVPLPLVPGELLGLVHRLLGEAPMPHPSPAPSAVPGAA